MTIDPQPLPSAAAPTTATPSANRLSTLALVVAGVGLGDAGAGYVLDSFGILLLPQHAQLFANNMIAPAIVAELSFTLWLLIKGVRTSQPEGNQAIAVAYLGNE